jgi:hypothetical protein
MHTPLAERGPRRTARHKPTVRIVGYPFLAALYSVLYVATSNSGEVVYWSDLLFPIAIALTVTLFSTLIGSLIAGDQHAGGVVGLLSLITFCVYGYIAGGFFETVGLGVGVRWEPVLLAVLLASLLTAAYLLRRRSVVGPGTTAWLSAVFGLLVVYSSGSFLLERLRPTTAVAASPAAALPPLTTRGDERPDIYLIVTDKYTGSRVLQSAMGFDNRPMIAELRKRGFVVPEAARANYSHTFLALASMLNLDYLDAFAAQLGRQNSRWEDLYPAIEYNESARLLRSLGYRFVFMPTALAATRQSRLADLQVPDPRGIQPEFSIAWQRTTMLPMFHRAWCAFRGCTVDHLPYVPETAALVDWKLQQLEHFSIAGRPSFVVAHLMVPHEPYIYDAQCRHVRPFWPQDSVEFRPPVLRAYLQQIECVNQKLLKVVDAIQRSARVPPVILIQADHGHGRLGRRLPSLDQVSPERVSERLSVFAAYAIPGLREHVPDTITPVNAMRLALRTALNLDLPALPDRSYWSSHRYPYDFTQVPVADGYQRPTR